MHTLKTLALGTLLLAGGTALATPRSWDYKLTFYPTAGSDCNAVAAQLGQAFHAATNLPVTRALCASTTDEGSNLVISYTAEAPVAAVSTLDPTHSGNEGHGAYLSLADCQAALPGEVQRLETETGLTPLVSYCYDDVFSDAYPVALRIDAFGTAAKQPFVSETMLFASPTSLSTAELEQTLLQAVRARGVDASYVRYEDFAGNGQLQMLYYAAAPNGFRVPDVGRLTDKGQCETESEVIGQAFAGRSDGPLVVVCGEDQVLGEVLASPIFLGPPAVQFNPAPETYPSYDACAASREALLAHYRNDLHRQVLGAVCGQPSTGGFEPGWGVTLIEVPSGR